MSNEIDWTQVSPAQLTLWYRKLCYHRFDDDLTQDELRARDTYRIVTAILELADPPSVAGYYSKVISEYHKLWIVKLPLFNRIGYIETTRAFDTGVIVYRLWLLSDWNETTNQARKRREAYAKQSHQWMKQRVAYWNVYKRLRAAGLAVEKAIELLKMSDQGARSGISESTRFLTVMGYIPPEQIPDDAIDSFLREFVFKPGHVYLNAWDFTQANPT